MHVDNTASANSSLLRFLHDTLYWLRLGDSGTVKWVCLFAHRVVATYLNTRALSAGSQNTSTSAD